MRSLRVLPFLIVIAVLAFSARLAYVFDAAMVTWPTRSDDRTNFASDSNADNLGQGGRIGQNGGAAEALEHAQAGAERQDSRDISPSTSPVTDGNNGFFADLEPAAGGAKKDSKKEDSMSDSEGSDASDSKDKMTEDAAKWRDASDQEAEYSNVRMELFEDLTKRRKALDMRDNALLTREALLKAAEQQLDRKYEELTALRAQIEDLLDRQSGEEQAQIDKLVKIYEGMKPKQAAVIFNTLDLDVLVAVLGKMSERKLSPILAAMNPERARTVTIMLAEQNNLPELPETQSQF